MSASLIPGDWLASSLLGARILIVDDDRAQCTYLSRVVEDWHAQPFAALTLSDALRLHKDAKPDLVLLDVMMPHVDGYKLAQIFKRDASFVPIILITALDDLESKRRGLAAGADEFLTKPINAFELQIRVASMLRIKKLADELEAANKRLNALATIDPLTQLVNRRVLVERIEQEFDRSKRYRHHLACVLADIDHFKLVNDMHGHPVGDKILVEVAAAIYGTIRKTDLAGRFGGEEFMVIAPETTQKQALILGERLRQAIVRRTSQRPELPAVTVSIGIATTELPLDSTDELVRRADEALYQAKREGRDRVVCASG